MRIFNLILAAGVVLMSACYEGEGESFYWHNHSNNINWFFALRLSNDGSSCILVEGSEILYLNEWDFEAALKNDELRFPVAWDSILAMGAHSYPISLKKCTGFIIAREFHKEFGPCTPRRDGDHVIDENCLGYDVAHEDHRNNGTGVFHRYWGKTEKEFMSLGTWIEMLKDSGVSEASIEKALEKAKKQYE